MTTLSIVTPWLNHSELIAEYESAVAGTEQVIIVDNGGANGDELRAMCKRLHADYIRNTDNRWFARACNQGLERANGDAVLFLNNDIVAQPGWLGAVRADLERYPGALLGAASGVRILAGQPRLYIDGWCVAATADVWRELGGWDDYTFSGPYWEDVDLSWRAARDGHSLLARPWKVRHLSNVTSATTPGAYEHSDANRKALTLKIREYETQFG